MIKLVIRGKEITHIRALHISVSSGEFSNYVLYGDPQDGFQEEHVLAFSDDDIDELVIKAEKQQSRR
jgi:hypothetical protein